MQKTLLSLALNSSRETGVPQWVWEVQRSFQKITEILCGSGTGKIGEFPVEAVWISFNKYLLSIY